MTDDKETRVSHTHSGGLGMATWSMDPGGNMRWCQASVLLEGIGGHGAAELAHCCVSVPSWNSYHFQLLSTILFTSHLTSLTSTIAPSSTSMTLFRFFRICSQNGLSWPSLPWEGRWKITQAAAVCQKGGLGGQTSWVSISVPRPTGWIVSGKILGPSLSFFNSVIQITIIPTVGINDLDTKHLRQCLISSRCLKNISSLFCPLQFSQWKQLSLLTSIFYLYMFHSSLTWTIDPTPSALVWNNPFTLKFPPFWGQFNLTSSMSSFLTMQADTDLSVLNTPTLESVPSNSVWEFFPSYITHVILIFRPSV